MLITGSKGAAAQLSLVALPIQLPIYYPCGIIFALVNNLKNTFVNNMLQLLDF